MAKLSNMIMFLMVLLLVMTLYTQNLDPAWESNSMWQFLFHFGDWKMTDFAIVFGALAASLAAAGIASGSLTKFIIDFPVMAAVIASFIGLGSIFMNLASQLGIALVRIWPECGASVEPCNAILFAKAVIIGPLAFYYLWTVIDFWKNRDI